MFHKSIEIVKARRPTISKVVGTGVLPFCKLRRFQKLWEQKHTGSELSSSFTLDHSIPSSTGTWWIWEPEDDLRSLLRDLSDWDIFC